MSKSTEAISKGIDILMKNPVLLAPYCIPIIIQLIFIALSYLFPIRYYYFYYVPNPYISFAGSFIALILGFIVGCMLVDMANDAISGGAIDMRKSLNLVMSRIGTLIIAAIIAAIFCIVIVLLPVALFIIVIAIIEKQDVMESVKGSFNFVAKNLGEVIIFLIIVIVLNVVFSLGFSLIPVAGSYIGSIITWFLNALFTVSAVYLYLSLRLPPPPPPPPPDVNIQ